MYGILEINNPNNWDTTTDEPHNIGEVLRSYNPPLFSQENSRILRETFESIENLQNIVEIGIGRDFKNSSLECISQCIQPHQTYLGIDKLHRRMNFNHTPSNMHFLQTDSSNTEQILNELEKVSGSKTIDLLHIDGFHSIDQIFIDFKLAENLSENGKIVVHDTNHHYGPIVLFNSLDPNIFKGTKYLTDLNNDWGIGVIERTK